MAKETAKSLQNGARATIVDVAREANVSYTTVADILRAKSRFSYRPETIQRVREAALRCGYETHIGARMMRQLKSTLIGIIVPTQPRSHTGALSLAIHQEIVARGYQSVVIGSQLFDPPPQTDDGSDIPAMAPLFADLRSLAGALMLDLTVELEVPPNVTRLLAALPYVATYPVTSPEINLVSYDFSLAIEQVVEHLVGLGHRRIAFASRFDDLHPTEALKVAGWRQGVERFQDSLDRRYDVSLGMCAVHDRQHMGIVIAEQLQALKHKPTALICPSDDVALSAMGQLMHRGWKIPEDISITGIDDIEFAAFTCPTLTTIRQPSRQIARAAVELLLNMITAGNAGENKELRPARQLFIEPQLVIRESTAPPGGNKK